MAKNPKVSFHKTDATKVSRQRSQAKGFDLGARGKKQRNKQFKASLKEVKAEAVHRREMEKTQARLQQYQAETDRQSKVSKPVQIIQASGNAAAKVVGSLSPTTASAVAGSYAAKTANTVSRNQSLLTGGAYQEDNSTNPGDQREEGKGDSSQFFLKA